MKALIKSLIPLLKVIAKRTRNPWDDALVVMLEVWLDTNE